MYTVCHLKLECNRGSLSLGMVEHDGCLDPAPFHHKFRRLDKDRKQCAAAQSHLRHA